jgi:hypothetical protein
MSHQRYLYHRHQDLSLEDQLTAHHESSRHQDMLMHFWLELKIMGTNQTTLKWHI